MSIKIGENEYTQEQLSEALKGSSYELHTSESINEKFGNLHQTYESKFLESTGIEKGQGEKGSDYIARVAKELNEKVTNFSGVETGYNTKISELEKSLTEFKKNGNEALKSDYNTLVSKHQELENSYTSLGENHSKELFSIQNANSINNVLNSFYPLLKEGTDKNAVNYVMESIKAQAMRNGVQKNEDGTHALLTEHGTVKVDPGTQKVILLEDLTAAGLDQYTRKEKSGSGTGGEGGNGSGGSVSIPDSIKTMTDLRTFLIEEKGLEGHSKEFISAWKAGKAKGLGL